MRFFSECEASAILFFLSRGCLATVEPRYINEVPGDWENVLLITGVSYIGGCRGTFPYISLIAEEDPYV